MKTEQDLIQGLNGVIKELQKKKRKLIQLGIYKAQRAKRRVLTLDINRLQRQKQMLEHLLIIGY